LPISQVALSQISNPDELVGKELQVTVIEIDSGQNRLIFSQKVQVSEETQNKLKELKNGQKIKGEVGGIMPFGLFIKLENGLEGLVHISEVSWEKVEDLNSLFKEGQEVECSVTSVDMDSGKVNLSLKQLSTDPFSEIAEKFQVDDVVKGTISKVTPTGVSVSLKNPSGEGSVEGTIPSNKLDPDTQYVAGNALTCIIDSIDVAKRRITLAPFVISTKDLIYK
jgi:small subunit ribosomal protein S1